MKTKVHIYFKQTMSSETRLSKEVKELSGKKIFLPKERNQETEKEEKKESSTDFTAEQMEILL